MPTYLVVFASPDESPCECEILQRMAHSFPTIAIDGGFGRCKAVGVDPVCVIGDFDSLGYVPEGADVRTHPRRKDASDGELGLAAAAEFGAERIIAIGALGGRFDHEYANVELFAREAEHGRRVAAIGPQSILFFLAGQAALHLPARDHGSVSVFSLTPESHGVCIEGFEYELHAETLPNRTSHGLSNEFCGKPTRISVREGTLLVVVAYESSAECREAIDAFLSSDA